jgi:hypothetical protein
MKIYPVLFCAIAMSCATSQKEKATEYIALFNGKNLEGWTPKISGFKAGENYKNTFRVEDGLLKVSYTEYDSFRAEFGHLFYKEKFSDYRLRIEYRFAESNLSGAPEWAFCNSGVMFHSQSAESMGIDQDFPVSLEAQFLGSKDERIRTTMNLCTPGTHVYMSDTLTTEHCINSTSKPNMLGDWVTVELIVFSDSIIHHLVNGDTVITYTKPTIGGGYLPENYSLPEGTPLTEGYLALQAESHPLDFRKVEVMQLKRN